MPEVQMALHSLCHFSIKVDLTIVAQPRLSNLNYYPCSILLWPRLQLKTRHSTICKFIWLKETCVQGDRIGWFFANWVIVDFWKFFWKLQSFSMVKVIYWNLTKYGFGKILGYFNKLVRSPCLLQSLDR
jgi:hypothetical protein